jgi:hypothetical protein
MIQRQNLYKVLKESHLLEIIADHQTELVTILFNYFDNEDLTKDFKNNLAKQFPDCFFALVQVNKPGAAANKSKPFIADNGKIVSELKGKTLPFVFFYYKGLEIGRIEEAAADVLNNTFAMLKTKIDESLGKQPEQQSSSNVQINPNFTNVVQEQPAAQPPVEQQGESQAQQQLMNTMMQQALAQQQLEKMKKVQQIYELEQLQKLKEMKELQEKQKK